jgi:hypothetical protein
VDQHVNVLRLVFPQLASTGLVRAEEAAGPGYPQENKILVSVLGCWGYMEYWNTGRPELNGVQEIEVSVCRMLLNPLFQRSIIPSIFFGGAP